MDTDEIYVTDTSCKSKMKDYADKCRCAQDTVFKETMS